MSPANRQLTDSQHRLTPQTENDDIPYLYGTAKINLDVQSQLSPEGAGGRENHSGKEQELGLALKKNTPNKSDFSSKMSSEINSLHQQLPAKHELLDDPGSHTGDTAEWSVPSSENQFPVPELCPECKHRQFQTFLKPHILCKCLEFDITQDTIWGKERRVL